MYQMLINGNLEVGAGKILPVYNPATGDVITELHGASKEQALQALKGADEAFKTWSKLSISEREIFIRNFKKAIEDNKNEILNLLILETGKPLSNALEDYEMLPNCLDFFIEETKRLNGELIPDYTDKHLNIIEHRPLGVVVGYLAWNFPLLNLGYKLGPILASGCTCVLKPSSITPLTTLFIGDIASKIFPAGVINIVAGSSSEIATPMNSSKIASMITLIGSSNTGKKIIEESTTSIKRYSLELGGNAPAIVFKDANLNQAATCIAGLKYANAGQICVSPNRVFVHQSVLEDFVLKVKDIIKNIILEVGDDTETPLMGPICSDNDANRLVDLVSDATKKGAKLILGGRRTGKGYFFEPTLIQGVTKEMRMYNEEIFGPIISIIPFTDEDDIIDLANDTEYGLAAYVYTNDLNTAMNVSRNIEAGTVCVNEPFYNFNLPHGGVKQSGIGKDCSHYSLEEYFDIRRVTIKI